MVSTGGVYMDVIISKQIEGLRLLLENQDTALPAVNKVQLKVEKVDKRLKNIEKLLQELKSKR